MLTPKSAPNHQKKGKGREGVLSILLNQPVRNQWDYQGKMESSQSNLAIHLNFDRDFDYCLAKSRTGSETRIFENGMAIFGRAGQSGQRVPL